jgi:monoamine oxidase
MTWTASVDVVVVGAGAAGLGAARHLSASGVSVVVLEAQTRVGGRAHTLTPKAGLHLDLGCGWLHSAEQNPLAKLAAPLGFVVDDSPAPWMRPALDVNFPAEDQKAYRDAFQALEDRLETAAADPHDRPASDLIQAGDQRWRPLFDAFSGYYNGAAFDCISVKDYAAYQPTEDNWRVRNGYGALIESLARGLDIRLSTPARSLRHGRDGVEVVTDAGVLEAHAAILAVPTSVIAQGHIALQPPLSDKVEAAAALPLGHVEKAFLKLDGPLALPVDSRVYGRTDTADTGNYTLRPMGMPVVEGFFGGDLAADLGKAAAGAIGAFAIDELVGVFGSSLRRRLSPLAESRWATDPFIGGAYSHARVGRADARATLSQPVSDRLFFAGEACSPHAFSTAHGAYETGIAAAQAAIIAVRTTG